MDTAQELKEIIKQTREEGVGITINLIARIIGEVFDDAEIKALITELRMLEDTYTEVKDEKMRKDLI